MSLTVLPVTINAATGRFVDPANGYLPLSQGSRPNLPAESKLVLGVHVVSVSGSNATDYPLGSGDTFECGGDGDFIHDATEGLLVTALVAASAVTAIVSSGLTDNDVPDTGRIRLYTAANELELIEYTAYDTNTKTFTVDHTMVYDFAGGERGCQCHVTTGEGFAQTKNIGYDFAVLQFE